MAEPRRGGRWMRVFSLEAGEGRRALFAALYLFLVIASYLALKPVRDSLFLDRFGAMNLPWVTLGYALGAGVFVVFYTRLARRIEASMLVVGTLLFFASNLVVFWWLAQREVPWLYPVLYIWVGVFGAIAPAQVWTVAGNLFTVREARRAFGVVGAGGVAGGIAGGFAGAGLSLTIGTINILLAVPLLLALAAWIVHRLSRLPQPRDADRSEAPPPSLRVAMRQISASPHMRLVACLVLLTAVATTLADWQFKTVVSAHYSGNEQTAFFSVFYGAANILAVTVQVLLTSRLMAWFGLGATLMLLPLSLFGATGWLLARPTLWAGTLLKGAEQTLKHSIDRASREMLYLPLSPGSKLAIKSTIDMVIDRLGDGLAALGLLGLIAVWGSLPPEDLVRRSALVGMLLIAVWLAVAMRLRRTYVDTLSGSIAAGKVQVASWAEALAGGETLGAIERTLRSGDEGAVLEALDLVAANPRWKLESTLLHLLRHGSPEVRARVMAILIDPSQPRLPEGLAESFGAEDQALLEQCLDILLAEEEEDRRGLIERLLERAGGRARGAWIVLLVRRLGDEYLPFAQQLMQRLLEPASPAPAREIAAAAIGNMPVGSGMHGWLPRLLQDEDPAVASAAAVSAGAVGGRELVGRLVPLLGARGTVAAARNALRRRRREALGPLLRCASDPAEDSRLRVRAVGVLSGIGTPESILGLLELLSTERLDVVEAAVRALLASAGERIGRDGRDRLECALADQVERLRDLKQARASLAAEAGPAPDPARALLLRGFEERWRRRRRLALRLVALLCGRDRPLPSVRHLDSDDAIERANAIELLENRPHRRLLRRVIPELLEDGRGASSPPTGAWRSCAGRLALERGSWIGALSRHLLGEEKGDTEMGQQVPTIVERVVALRRVELFSQIPSEDLARIAALASEQTLPAGSELCREGDSAGDLLVLTGGRARVERDGQAFGTLEAGQAIGAWDLFDERPRSVTVVAEDEVTLLRMDRYAFDELLGEQPEIARSFISHLVSRLRRVAQAAAPRGPSS